VRLNSDSCWYNASPLAPDSGGGWGCGGSGVTESAGAFLLSLLADGCLIHGRYEQGLQCIDRALQLVDKNDERAYEAELWRLRAALALAPAGQRIDEAIECAYQALTIARERELCSFELHAALSLYPMLCRQNRAAEAQARLTEAYEKVEPCAGILALERAQALLESATDTGG
jgi:tetratricopeptide (TPR) repeat protein